MTWRTLGFKQGSWTGRSNFRSRKSTHFRPVSVTHWDHARWKIASCFLGKVVTQTVSLGTIQRQNTERFKARKLTA
jgi:hypothetical protein